MSQFELPNFPLERSSKSAFLMTKELTFHKAGGKGCTVDLNERSMASWTALMDGSGNQLFASPCFPVDQHRCVGLSNAIDRLEHLLQQWAPSNDLFKIELCFDLLAEIHILPGKLVREVFDFSIGEGVFQRKSKLFRNVEEKPEITGQHGYYGHRTSRFYGPDGVRYRAVGDVNNLGAIDINVKPKNTQVYLNGNYVGVTGKFDGFPDYLWLEEGTYELTFYNEGYMTVVQKFAIRQGAVIDVKLRLVLEQ